MFVIDDYRNWLKSTMLFDTLYGTMGINCSFILMENESDTFYFVFYTSKRYNIPPIPFYTCLYHICMHTLCIKKYKKVVLLSSIFTDNIYFTPQHRICKSVMSSSEWNIYHLVSNLWKNDVRYRYLRYSNDMNTILRY